MALTRPNLDAALVRICGPTLTKVGRDGTTVDGTNVDLSIGIGMALLAMERDVADISSVTTSELSGVTGGDVKLLIDVSRVEIYENILSNWAQPDETAGTDNEQLNGKLRDSIEKTVTRWKAELRDNYGIGTGSPPSIDGGIGTLEVGSYDQNTADRLSDLTGWVC